MGHVHAQALLLCLLGLSLANKCCAAVCQEACQAEQRVALLRLYSATGGKDWDIPEPWDGVEPAYSNETLPAHCGEYRPLRTVGTASSLLGNFLLDTTHACRRLVQGRLLHPRWAVWDARKRHITPATVLFGSDCPLHNARGRTFADPAADQPARDASSRNFQVPEHFDSPRCLR